MNLTLEIPDEIAQRLGASVADLSRYALEVFTLEEYKAGRISKAELRLLLGFHARHELDAFLKAHDAWADVTAEDLRQDMRDLESLGL